MRNLLTTLKYSLLNNLAINKLRRKDNLAKFSFGKILLLILIVIVVFFSSLLYAFIFGSGFVAIGHPELILALGIFFGIILTLIVSVTNATAYIFKSKDFDLLMSLPIKENTVILSKIFYLLIVNYVSFFFIYVPTLIVYANHVPTDIVFWLLSIVTFVLTPLLPATIAIFIAYVLSLIVPKFRYKNFFTIILSIIFIVIIMVISFSSSMASNDPTKFGESVKSMLPTNGLWAFDGMRGEYLQYLYFVLITVIPFIILTRILGMFYLKANTKHSTSSTSRAYKVLDLKSQSQNKTLIKKELKRYLGSPPYVLNTIVGPLLSTIFLFLFKFTSGTSLEEGGMALSDLAFVPPLLVAFVLFSLGTTSTTASCISIEGKQFWIMKSLPITPGQIFLGKISVNLIISVPIIIINSIVSVIFFDFQIIDAFMMFLIPLLFSLFMSALGLYINLLFPRFDYDSDVKAVKQSISALITMGIGFVLAILTIVIGSIIIFNTGNNIYAYLSSLGITVVINIVIYSLLHTHGSKVFRRIVA